MTTKDLQKLNFKFNQVMLNSLVSRGKFWSDVWYFVSLSIPNKYSWKLFRYLSVLKLFMMKAENEKKFEKKVKIKCENCDNLGL